jgi:hypothetical protein
MYIDSFAQLRYLGLGTWCNGMRDLSLSGATLTDRGMRAIGISDTPVIP